MRLKIIVILILLGGLILTGCSTNNTGSSNFAAQGSESPGGGNGQETSLALKLALGTFKLDKTDYPITPEQANELLFLWKAVSVLSKSETAAPQELQALVKQIQKNMTSEQIQAIDKMDLSYKDMNSIAEEMGLDFGSGGFGNMSPEMQSTMQAARQSGQGSRGDFGGLGIPGGGPGGGFGSQARETQVVQSSGLGLPSPLLDAVIKFLQAKVQ